MSQNESETPNGGKSDRNEEGANGGSAAPDSGSRDHQEQGKDQEPQDKRKNSGKEEKKNLSPEEKRKARRKKKILIIAGIGVAVIALVAGVLWWLHARHFESTDDAYIDTDIIHLAPRASGQVTQVYVTDNQAVAQGQVLVQLDDSVAETQLAQGKASRQQALAQIAQAEAQIGVADAQLQQAHADTEGPAADAAKAKRDYQRYSQVKSQEPGAVSSQQLDAAQTNVKNASAQLLSAQKRVRIAGAQLAAARTQLNAGRAQLQAADAQMQEAKVQINYAQVVSPVAGYITHREVASGNFATQGQELLAIVPTYLWVTANFKETQLTDMRLGQHVDLEIDAYPDADFPAHVDSIQRGAGQSFAILPAQNATGNFVKVVQRVPVKIVFDNAPDPRYPLGPGMSVTPKVRVR